VGLSSVGVEVRLWKNPHLFNLSRSFRSRPLLDPALVAAIDEQTIDEAVRPNFNWALLGT